MTLMLEKQSDYNGDDDQGEKRDEEQRLKETNIHTERDVVNEEATPLSNDDATPQT